MNQESLTAILTGFGGGVLPALFCRYFWRKFVAKVEELAPRLETLECRLLQKAPPADPGKN